MGGQMKKLSPMEKKGSGARGHTGRREFGGVSLGRSLKRRQSSVSRDGRIGQRRWLGGRWAEAWKGLREPGCHRLQKGKQGCVKDRSQKQARSWSAGK